LRLAGGIGARLSKETSIKSNPMVEIGGKPILFIVLMILLFAMGIFTVLFIQCLACSIGYLNHALEDK
jgi:NDP-sugar pyrophosphorylase family protein